MSHVVTLVGVPIRDIDSLKTAAERLGGKLIKSSTYRWFGTHVGDYPLPAGFTKSMLGKCEYKITFPETDYDIGIYRKSPNEFGLIYDFYGPNGGKLKKYLQRKTLDGVTGCPLLVEYSAVEAEKAAMSIGEELELERPQWVSI